jgi:hypothetical protein
MSTERRLPIDGHEGYSVSDHGRVRSEPRAIQYANGKVCHLKGRVMRPARKPLGHLSVCLYAECKAKRAHVHRLVALAFIGEPPTPLHEVAHNDGNASNNMLSNLRWATRSENHMDKVAHGTHNRGEAHPLCLVSDAVVRNIRASELPAKKVALQFGVSLKYASAIKLGTARRFA